MSSNSFFLKADIRNDLGKGASRRLRRENKMPAVIYGGEGEPVSITVSHFAVLKSLNSDSFYSQIIDIEIDGEVTEVILRDLQRHPYKAVINHADFQRIVRGQDITVNVPLHFTNIETSVGIKAGGIINQQIIDVEISCRPSSLPESIVVDVQALDVNNSIHLAELILPEGVTITSLDAEDDSTNISVVSIHPPKVEEAAEESTEEATPEADAE